jgi:hypothetical protein
MSEESKDNEVLHERKSPKLAGKRSLPNAGSRDGEASKYAPVLSMAKDSAGPAAEVTSRPQAEAQPAAEVDGHEESLNVTKVLNIKQLATAFSAGSKNPNESSFPVAEGVPVRHADAEAESFGATKLLEVQSPATVVSSRSGSTDEKKTVFDQKSERDQRIVVDRKSTEEGTGDAASINPNDELNTQSVTAATFRKIKLHDIKSSEESTAAPSNDKGREAEEPQVADESGATRFFQAPGAAQKEHVAAKTPSADLKSPDWSILSGVEQGEVSKFGSVVSGRPVLESTASGSSEGVEQAVGGIRPERKMPGGRSRSGLSPASSVDENYKSTMLQLIPLLTILNLCFTALLLGATFRLVHILGGMSRLVSLLHR